MSRGQGYSQNPRRWSRHADKRLDGVVYRNSIVSYLAEYQRFEDVPPYRSHPG